MSSSYRELMNHYGSIREPFIFIINYRGDESIITPVKDIDRAKVLFKIGNYTNSSSEEIDSVGSEAIKFNRYPISQRGYSVAFNRVMNELKRGNTYLINLTQPTVVDTTLSLDDIFARSRAQYKILVKGLFTTFSPETFIKIRDGKISSFPMKGTIDASIENAEDIILSSKKESAEHYTIVDLIRNDLSQVATDVYLKRDRYIDRIETNSKNLLQVSSEIEGTLTGDYHSSLGDIFFNLLPAGSITGAPKEKTINIIESAEGYNRGYYTGVCGYYDGESLDSGVMIRFIEETPDGMIFKSGGGVTAMSSAISEYEEMVDKVYLPFV